jgi:hypothetical protein
MEPRNVAIIGLGVGSCATYFKEGESLTFYELDPYIEDIASDRFTYLDDCKAKVTIVPGDARIQLEQAPDHSYDIIMVDAFSSDAIPTHLLTKEAFSLYEQKLAPQGKLVFHITNRYYDLLGVIKSTSAERWEALAKQSNKKLKPLVGTLQDKMSNEMISILMKTLRSVEKPTEGSFEELIEYTRVLDIKRKQNVLKVFPHLKEVFDAYQETENLKAKGGTLLCLANGGTANFGNVLFEKMLFDF